MPAALPQPELAPYLTSASLTEPGPLPRSAYPLNLPAYWRKTLRRFWEDTEGQGVDTQVHYPLANPPAQP